MNSNLKYLPKVYIPTGNMVNIMPGILKPFHCCNGAPEQVIIKNLKNIQAVSMLIQQAPDS